ncbi:hypothetical protein B0H16DRAFT_1494964 [Mycena metata]|uniref:Uncharacterized protein n=1 Tax=Mycena metata TaxID=1033252 RepID=A0AAD7KCV9_9AGAR|nr:hypothetical protein B0H16DRAFT_1494964 [Mycena metata]
MLRTATRLARRPPLVAQSRPSSSVAAHDAHNDHHEQDDTVYPKEGFTGPIWRKTLALTLGAAAFYEFLGAPADGDLPWFPLINLPAARDLEVASTRAAAEKALLDSRQLVRTAVRPPIYRTRNPEDFNHISPYGNPVGMDVHWKEPTGATRSKNFAERTKEKQPRHLRLRAREAEKQV